LLTLAALRWNLGGGEDDGVDHGKLVEEVDDEQSEDEPVYAVIEQRQQQVGKGADQCANFCAC
jgi:hypothetical protein